MVAHPADMNTDFFVDLPRDRLFQTFPGFDESGEGRKHRQRVAPIVSQHAPVPPMDKHDDGGVGARKMRCPAVRVGADANVAGIGRFCGAAAAGAEGMAIMPVKESFCV